MHMEVFAIGPIYLEFSVPVQHSVKSLWIRTVNNLDPAVRRFEQITDIYIIIAIKIR